MTRRAPSLTAAFGRSIEDSPVARKPLGGGVMRIRTGTGILDWNPESFARSIRSRTTREAGREERSLDISNKKGQRKGTWEAIDLSWESVKGCGAGTMDEASEGGKRKEEKRTDR
jgi:hypothetical protein